MRRNRAFYSLLVVLMVVPLMAMALLPLADTTEPRYAAIARLMAESGDWITLWYAPGVPLVNDNKVLFRRTFDFKGFIENAKKPMPLKF